MTKFYEKLKTGEVPTDEEWAEYLQAAHKEAPSMTPAAFAAHKTASGQNSYEILADTVQPSAMDSAQILDLACGDGHLIPYLLPKLGTRAKVIGVDMSEGELAVARTALTDPRVSFLLAKAQSLPIERASIDHVVCHMAFMLMVPVEPVVAEIGRVLKPQGTFSAIIGGRSSSGFHAEIQRTCYQFIDARYPKVRETRAGDPRVNTLEGLQSLFTGARGFLPMKKVEDIVLNFHTTPEGVWAFMRDMYFVSMLAPQEKAELKTELLSLCKPALDSEGKVSFQYPMKLIVASRNGH